MIIPYGYMFDNENVTLPLPNYSVGKNGINTPDDVMLVQFLMKRFFEINQWKVYKPAGTFKVDGSCGPKTRAWILAVQNALTKHYPVATDGRISTPALSSKAWDAFLHYTIIVMCKELHRDRPGFFPCEDYSDVNVTFPPEDMPPLLTQSLKIAWSMLDHAAYEEQAA